MTEPAKTQADAPPAGGELREIESLLARLDRPSEASRVLLFCASLVAIGFVAAQNFNVMTTAQTVLNACAAAAFVLSMAVVFFQRDFRVAKTSDSANASPPMGVRAYLAPLKSLPGIAFVCRQRFDRISFTLIVLGIVLVFAAKIGRFTADTHV
jgi:hypothetical protein